MPNAKVNNNEIKLTTLFVQHMSNKITVSVVVCWKCPRMFKYKEKTAFTYNIQIVVHCRKFSMK